MIEFIVIICGLLFIAVVVLVLVFIAIEGTNTAAAIDEWVAEKIRKETKWL